jgi:hypothetical protein
VGASPPHGQLPPNLHLQEVRLHASLEDDRVELERTGLLVCLGNDVDGGHD